MRDVYYVATGMYTTEAETELVELGFCLIFQVMGRFHKKHPFMEEKHLFRNIWTFINPS